MTEQEVFDMLVAAGARVSFEVSPCVYVGCDNDLPLTLRYYGLDGDISRCEITKVEFCKYDNALYVGLYGTKTYDRSGNYGDKCVRFRWVLRSSTNKIIASDTVYIENLVVNQELHFPDGAPCVIIKLCDLNRLTEFFNYELHLVDYSLY